MPRTQVQEHDIANRILTGASFHQDLNMFDETSNYAIDDTVFWKNSNFKTTSTITSLEEGDLSNSPDNNNNWVEIEALKYNVFPSTSQTFNSTPVVLQLDTERLADSQGRISLVGSEVEFNFSGSVIVYVQFTTDNTSGTRTNAGAYLSISTNGGTVYNNIPNSTIWTYSRNDSDGKDTGSTSLPVEVNTGDRIIVQMYSPNGNNIETIPTGCNLTIFTTSGSQGNKGEVGPAGPSGDIIWLGDYDNSGSSVYNINESVYWQGSSWISLINNNSDDPSESSTNWSYIAKVGDDGSGTSLLIEDDGTSVPNSPHSTLNFIGDVTATDSGSGTCDVIIHTKQTYNICIWAEENSGLGNSTYEWAFGNGANTPQNYGCPIFIPSGYQAEIVAVGLTIGAGQAEVDVEINGASSGCSSTTDHNTNPSNINEVVPYLLSNNDRLNFKTLTSSGTSGPCVANCWIKYTEI